MPAGVYERKTYELVCSVCGQSFHVKQRKGRVCSKCQKRMNDKKYYFNNRDMVSVRSKMYRDNNKAAILKKNRDYYLRNKDRCNEQSRLYYKDNRHWLLSHYESKRRECGIKSYKTLTKTEMSAYSIIVNLFPNYTVVCKDRNLISNPRTGLPFELDFYIPELRLAIELNGAIHYEPIFGENRLKRQRRNDLIKHIQCIKKGIKLVSVRLKSGVHYELLTDRLSECIRNALNRQENV